MTPQWKIFHGDALELLRTLPDDRIDSIVTDPPAGISFMGRDWDHDKGGRAQWVVWLTEIMRECLRVLKPGAHALVWALPRTSHWTGTAIEDAGFEVVDVITHHYGSGMPKSKDASKAIDARLGTTGQRTVTSTYTAGGNAGTSTAEKGGTYGVGVANSAPVTLTRSNGGSPEARRWDGWGTGLKPSSEHWILARKPRAGTLANNLLQYSVGGVNVDGCRVVTDWQEPDRPASWAASAYSAKPEAEKIAAPPGIGMTLHPEGRWPANTVFTHSSDCRLVGIRSVPSNGSILENTAAAAAARSNHVYGEIAQNRGAWSPYGNGDGTETVPVYECAVDCPVRALEAQSGVSGREGELKISADTKKASTWTRKGGGLFQEGKTNVGIRCFGDAGTAARFFPRFEWSGELDDPFLYAAKASTREREGGCEYLPPNANGRHNPHNTVKPVALMRWLCRLVTPPEGLCLDPFTGSGTTGVAAVLEGFHFMGFEIDAGFASVAHARIEHWRQNGIKK